jgi:disulfide bond formation protein DsbB
MEFGPIFTKANALATLAGNLGLVGLLLFWIVRRSIFQGIVNWLGERAFSLAIAISSLSIVGSLLYSQVVGFPACTLCWIQRAFMYPIPFVLALGIWAQRKPRVILLWALVLSLAGGVVALYHWVKDMLLWYAHMSAPCPAITGVPACDRIYVLEFNYITIAMFALNAFAWIALVCWAGLRKYKA